MSVEFIKNRLNANHIQTAQRQQKQLLYFTQSEVQQEINIKYLQEWANRNFIGSDFFLNWIKTLLKTPNFLSFYKQLRYPLASATIINEEVIPQLKRVFHAEDSYFRYLVSNKVVECPDFLKKDEFTQKIFNAILFHHNDIVISDLEETNKPFREIIPIDSVISIDSDCGKIKRIAYNAEVMVEDEMVQGYLYIDEKAYIFYNRLYVEKMNIPHDLKVCPADYISSESMGPDAIRKSIFSYSRPDLESYVVLTTLQKMADLNGTLPVVTKMKAKEVSTNIADKNKKGEVGEPMAANTISGQVATINTDINTSTSPTQAGTVIEVPTMTDIHKNVNVDVVKNFLVFHYMPVECLEFLKKRIADLKNSIIASLLGDFEEQNQSAKNELQVSKSYVNKQDKLRWVSNELTRIIGLSDYKTMALRFGPDRTAVDLFYGSDFFLETESDLMLDFAKAPNPIIRKNILARLAQNSNKFNPIKAEREKLLYKLLPFASDTDFKAAIDQQVIQPELKIFQIRFDYWIMLFEAEYGDLLMFYNQLGEAPENQKLIFINNILTEMVKQNSDIPSQELEKPIK